MTGWQPPAVPEHRVKTPFCRARSKAGSRCDLYVGHEAVEHRDSHTDERWSDNG